MYVPPRKPAGCPASDPAKPARGPDVSPPRADCRHTRNPDLNRHLQKHELNNQSFLPTKHREDVSMLTTCGSRAPGQGAETMGTSLLPSSSPPGSPSPRGLSRHYSIMPLFFPFKTAFPWWGRLGGSLPSICLPLGHEWGGSAGGLPLPLPCPMLMFSFSLPSK